MRKKKPESEMAAATREVKMQLHSLHASEGYVAMAVYAPGEKASLPHPRHPKVFRALYEAVEYVHHLKGKGFSPLGMVGTDTRVVIVRTDGNSSTIVWDSRTARDPGKKRAMKKKHSAKRPSKHVIAMAVALKMRGSRRDPDETVACKKCGAKVDPLAVFPGGICVACHEKRYNAEVRRTGVMPRPDFGSAVRKRSRRDPGGNPSFALGFDKGLGMWKGGHTFEEIKAKGHAIHKQGSSPAYGSGLVAAGEALAGWYDAAEAEARKHGYSRAGAEMLVGRAKPQRDPRKDKRYFERHKFPKWNIEPTFFDEHRLAKKVFPEMSKKDHEFKAMELAMEADKAVRAYHEAVNKAHATYGGEKNGPFYTDLDASWPDGVKENVRKLRIDADRLKAAAYQHWKAAGRRNIGPVQALIKSTNLRDPAWYGQPKRHAKAAKKGHARAKKHHRPH